MPRQPIAPNPAPLGLSPRPTPLGADLVPSERPLAPHAHSGRSERRGEGGPAPSSAGRSRGDRAVSAVSLRDAGSGGGGGRRGKGRRRETQTWRRSEKGRTGRSGRRADQRSERDTADEESRGGAHWTGSAVQAGRAGTPGRARPARAHLVTVRRARGLCALSRPRRAPMPARTSSAATPHTA